MRSDPNYPQQSRASNRSQPSDRSPSRGDHRATDKLNQAHHENEELRHQVSAQTSMLTSRNREKDRLYQEIEELKLQLRGGGNPTPSSHYDRSESRAQSVSDRILDRSVSRQGGNSVAGTQITSMTESERDDYENKNGMLRDRISELRLRNQDLEQQLESYHNELEQMRAEREEMEDELEIAQSHVQEMQAERNEVLRGHEEISMDFHQLKREAEEEIDKVEEEVEIRGQEIIRLEEELRIKEDDFVSLQQEMRNVSDVVVRLEDSHDIHQGELRQMEDKIHELEGTIQDNEQELNALEGSLREANEKVERLTVQSESSKGEIGFLREEQDGDKIKIGELESLVKRLEDDIAEEQDRVREAHERLSIERKEREERGDIRHQEWEQHLNQKNVEIGKWKDEVRKLRGKVQAREEEAHQWRDRLDELESSLREVLGDHASTSSNILDVRHPTQPRSVHSNILQSVKNLQLRLDQALDDLDDAKATLADEQRAFSDRDQLLESQVLESRKLADLLDKERAARKSERAAFEQLQTTQSTTSRRIAEHSTKVTELERQRNRDNRSLNALESQYKEAIADRNSLLLQSWTRLSAVCGKDFAHRNATVNMPTTTATTSSTPSSDKLTMDQAISSSLPAFTKNYLLALKSIESIVAGFKTKLKTVERDLWKEYHVVESALESRSRRLDRLESLVRGGIGDQSAARTEAAKLRTENRLLKTELNLLKQAAEKSSPPAGPAVNVPHVAPALQRSRTQVDPSMHPGGLGLMRNDSSPSLPNYSDTDSGEKRWILRLRELEKRLKNEREQRMLERGAASRHVMDVNKQKEEIKMELEREKVRAGKN